jgi:hypothetical protein
MRAELDNILCADFPELFRDRHAPMTKTAMCWGFECGDGWYTLIRVLCLSIMANVYNLRRDIAEAQARVTDPDNYTNERSQALEAQLKEAVSELPVVTQVKEKYGGLRFYCSGGTPTHRAYIGFAERMSYYTCERCGTTDDVKLTGQRWYYTRCKSCAAAQGLTDEPDTGDVTQPTLE